ncbi:MAG: CopG family transcriptional regulator [Thermoleophilaceae bacterium]
MAGATRTQIHLTVEQREKLDALSAKNGRSLADLVREALDAYLAGVDPQSGADVLDETFGSLPELEVPSRDELDRG